MIGTIRRLTYMTTLLAAVLLFAFVGTEVYAAEAILDENTTQLENGFQYHVNGEKTIGDRIEVAANSKAILYLRKNAILNAEKGIYVPSGSTLIIDGAGSLIASGTSQSAGIGGKYDYDCGEIRIQGNVDVTAKGGNKAPGIGSGYNNRFNGRVRISGGSVTAIGGIDAAGIGTGPACAFAGSVIISGGKVTASSTVNTSRSKTHSSDTSGPGIGAGSEAHMKSATITISGGEVKAVGGPKAAGIGCAEQGNADGLTVNIRGGSVEAVGGGEAAGIGGGEEYISVGGSGANVNITGGTVVVNSEHRAIGPGGSDSVTGDLMIADQLKVQAGNNGTNYEKTCSADGRVSACRDYKCVRIEECEHSDYTYVSDDAEHAKSCQYCQTNFPKEAHAFEIVEGTAIEASCIQQGRDADQKCTICGYEKVGQKTDFASHDWGETTYTWTSDNSACTARRVCRTDPTHIESEMAKSSPGGTKKPGCEENGEIVLKATFQEEDFAAQTKIISLPAYGHNWGEWAVTTPATEEAEGVETRTCLNDPSHTETRLIPCLDPSEEEGPIAKALRKIRTMIENLIKSYDKDKAKEAYETYDALPGYGQALLASYFSEEDLETLQAAWNKYAKSLKTVIQSAKAKNGGKVLVKWKENPLADGYQLFCKAKGTKAKKLDIDSETTLKKAVSQLKDGKKYSFKIRPYLEFENLKTGDPIKVFGKWSDVKKAKVKK